MSADIRLGDWRTALDGVEVDAIICDPPYSNRTHEGHNAMEQQTIDITGQATRTAISYASMSPADVH